MYTYSLQLLIQLSTAVRVFPFILVYFYYIQLTTRVSSISFQYAIGSIMCAHCSVLVSGTCAV